MESTTPITSTADVTTATEDCCVKEPFVVPTFPPLTLMELVTNISKELTSKTPDMRIMDALMRAYDASLGEFKRYVHWNPQKKYTRNLIATDDQTFTLMLLCWNGSTASPIHNHHGSECFMRIVQGNVVENKYEVTDNPNSTTSTGNELATVKLFSHRVASEGSVLFINDSMGVHKIENPFPTPAITLHCYMPPYQTCKLYDESTAEVRTGFVTYDSEPYSDDFD